MVIPTLGNRWTWLGEQGCGLQCFGSGEGLAFASPSGDMRACVQEAGASCPPSILGFSLQPGIFLRLNRVLVSGISSRERSWGGEHTVPLPPSGPESIV